MLFVNSDLHFISEAAPSNIALIKYMGKIIGSGNLSTNPSLSYTLNKLTSSVVIQERLSIHNLDLWKPLDDDFKLSIQSQNRFLKHWEYLKKYFNIEGNYTVFSGNNFPTSCGLASSASSFAALTKAAYQVSVVKGGDKTTLLELANLSRRGSGSSCRSLFSPWVEWKGDSIKNVVIDNSYVNLQHDVLLFSTEKKKTSSSEAHKRVLKHSNFSDRIKRTENRFTELKQLLLEPNQFLSIQKLVWDEFMDMHQLFKTCPEPFSYLTSVIKIVLKDIKAFIISNKIKVWVTMDAGPNIHFLYTESEKDKLDKYLSEIAIKYKISTLSSLNREKQCLK